MTLTDMVLGPWVVDTGGTTAISTMSAITGQRLTAVGIEGIATAAKPPKGGTHASQPGTVHGDMSVVKRGQFWLVILFENKNKIEKLITLKKRQHLKGK